jgi:hypothetical protein
MLGCIALLVGSLPLATTSMAQGGTQDISIWTYENDGSGSSTDACYVLLGYSQEGCDLNGDGAVLFEDVAYGTYTVRQTADLGPGRYVDDFTITVNGGVPDFAAFIITVALAPEGPAAGTRDLYIATVLGDASFYDACYVLVGYSLVGCDENRDGYVLFEDVAYGSYTARQTADISPYWVYDFTIDFRPTTDNVFYAYVDDSPAVIPSEDLSLITRDPDDGELLRGACYELVGYSNVGCDENRDGQVTFKDVRVGDHTVRQVTAPRGYDLIEDFPITVTTSWDYLGVVVSQDSPQAENGTDNVSIVFIDGNTFERVADDNICVTLINGSQTGCDDSLVDGQVDFLGVRHGSYGIGIESLPQGYALWDPAQKVIVDGTDELLNTVWFVYIVPID